MEIIKLLASIMTPILVLIFGVIITKDIEKIKNTSAKEKEWQVKWGEVFFTTFLELNTLMEDLLVTLYEMYVLAAKGDTNSSRAKELHENYDNLLIKIRAKEFALKTQLGFAPGSRKLVSEKTSKLFELVNEAASGKRGNMDEIQAALIELNRVAIIAHKEILGLSAK